MQCLVVSGRWPMKSCSYRAGPGYYLSSNSKNMSQQCQYANKNNVYKKLSK